VNRLLIPLLGSLSLLGLAALGLLVFAFTPSDEYMGFSQKIMYIHVPSMWVAYLAFFIVFFCSIGYLWKRSDGFDRVAKCSAEIGVLFCGLGLLTGAIWGRPTWGTYWVWDARLTTTLILLLIMPFLWSIPIALATAELTSMLPVDGGYYRWARKAFGGRRFSVGSRATNPSRIAKRSPSSSER